MNLYKKPWSSNNSSQLYHSLQLQNKHHSYQRAIWKVRIILPTVVSPTHRYTFRHQSDHKDLTSSMIVSQFAHSLTGIACALGPTLWRRLAFTSSSIPPRVYLRVYVRWQVFQPRLPATRHPSTSEPLSLAQTNPPFATTRQPLGTTGLPSASTRYNDLHEYTRHNDLHEYTRRTCYPT